MNGYWLFHHRLALVVLAVVAMAGCSSVATTPDLGAIYAQAARADDRERNPIIVVPGILGSKLRTFDDETPVWGAFGGAFANPSQPDGARLVALPMQQGQPLADLRDEVYAFEVLDSVSVSLLGLPVELGAYVHLLRVLGVSGGYRDQSLNYGDVQYSADHFTCFQFPYDWRRDIVESARQLDSFLKGRRAFVEEQFQTRWGESPGEFKFDIVAHSMGGLVVRYYLMYGTQDLPAEGSLPELTWEGADQFENVIIVGTPNAGSAEAYMQLRQGADFGPFTAAYSPAILGTMPSIYQLLPRARHAPVLDGTTGEPYPDYMDPALWIEAGWGLADPGQAGQLEVLLPDIAGAGMRETIAEDHLRKSLARAWQFHAAMDVPSAAPDGIKLHLMAADSLATPQSVTALANGGLGPAASGPGDGTVLRSSALMDERTGQPWRPKVATPIDWDQVTFVFDDHLGMTRNPVFVDNLLYQLLEAP